MDGGRFDRVTRNLARATTRRGVLRGALAGLFGGAALLEAADAATRRRPVCLAPGVNCTRGVQCCSGRCDRLPRGGGRSPRYGCGCEGQQTLCGRACFDLWTDVDNCGACGHACGANADCIDGECVSTAPTSCYQFVPNVATDELVCGIAWDEREIFGCDWEYFADIEFGGSYPCTTDADCQDGSSAFTGSVNCASEDAVCYCELGWWNPQSEWVPNTPYQCVWVFKPNTCE